MSAAVGGAVSASGRILRRWVHQNINAPEIARSRPSTPPTIPPMAPLDKPLAGVVVEVAAIGAVADAVAVTAAGAVAGIVTVYGVEAVTVVGDDAGAGDSVA